MFQNSFNNSDNHDELQFCAVSWEQHNIEIPNWPLSSHHYHHEHILKCVYATTVTFGMYIK